MSAAIPGCRSNSARSSGVSGPAFLSSPSGSISLPMSCSRKPRNTFGSAARSGAMRSQKSWASRAGRSASIGSLPSRAARARVRAETVPVYASSSCASAVFRAVTLSCSFAATRSA